VGRICFGLVFIVSGNRDRVGAMTSSHHLYEVRPRKDRRGVDLISDALPFGRLWYGEPNAASNAIGYAQNQTNNTGSKMKKSGLE
jgi:hypothetical protein